MNLGYGADGFTFQSCYCALKKSLTGYAVLNICPYAGKLSKPPLHNILNDPLYKISPSYKKKLKRQLKYKVPYSFYFLSSTVAQNLVVMSSKEGVFK